MADSIGQAYVQILPTTQGFGSKLSAELGGGATAKASKKAGLSIGKGITAGFAAAGVGVAAAGAIGKSFVKNAKQVAEYGDQVDKLSQRVGLSKQAYQEWDYVLQISGTDMANMKMGMKTLTNQLAQAKKGSKDSQEYFKKLGLSMSDLKNMSREDLFSSVIKGFQQMEEGTDRAALANKLFGRSGQELTPVFNQSSKETEKLIDNAHKYGIVVSDEAVTAAARFKDSLTTLEDAANGLKNRLFANFLPSITGVMEGLTNIIAGNSEKGAKLINDNLSTLFEKIASALPTALNVAPSIILTIGQSLVSNLPIIFPALINFVSQLGNGIINAAPMLLNAGISLVIKLGQTLISATPKIIPALATVVTKLAVMLTAPNNMTKLVNASIDFMFALQDGLIAALPILIDALPTIIINVTKSLIELAPKLLTVGSAWNKGLAKGMTISISHLGSAAEILKKTLIEKLKKINLSPVGKNMILGMLKGVTEGFDILLRKWTDLLKKIPKVTEKKYEVGSPSKLFERIFAWVPAGAALGITKNSYLVDEAIAEMGSGAGSLMRSGSMSLSLANAESSAQALNYQEIYEAVKQGASSAQPVIILDGRVMSRELKGMGVKFA